VPAFYSRPDSIADMVDHSVGRVLDLFDIDVGAVTRWGETAGPTPRRIRAVDDQDVLPASKREKP
jgi:4-hydroxy-3-polyprenylbenzoate decarboxylase